MVNQIPLCLLHGHPRVYHIAMQRLAESKMGLEKITSVAALVKKQEVPEFLR